jgi:lysozyme
MSLQSSLSISVPFIQARERFSPAAYWDANGYAIGYGNHYYLDGSYVRAGDTISQSDALLLLQATAQGFGQKVLSEITAPLTDNQLAALTSLAYNCGSIPPVLRGMINAGASADKIAQQIQVTCITSEGVVSEDLIDRRALEADLYLDKTNPGRVLAFLLLAGLGFAVYKIATG